MACFLVPVAEAIITTAITQVVKSNENKVVSKPNSGGQKGSEIDKINRIPFSKKLKWLSNLLWGGSFLLAFEHIWHGEVVPWFPFLTAASNPADAATMLHEMATVGVSMMVFVTLVWVAMVLVTNAIENKPVKEELVSKPGSAR